MNICRQFNYEECHSCNPILLTPRTAASRKKYQNITEIGALDEPFDIAPKFYPVVSSLETALKCYPFLVSPKLESSGVIAQAGEGAGELITSDIGGLLPIALSGLTSL